MTTRPWTMDELLDIDPPDKEMFHLEWDPSVSERTVGLTRPVVTWDCALVHLRSTTLEPRAYISSVGVLAFSFPDFPVSNMCLDNLYSSTHRMQHGGHTGDDTCGDFYASRNPGTDGQNSYLGDKPRTIVKDRFRAMTLSRNPELWQSFQQRSSMSWRIRQNSSPSRSWNSSLSSSKTTRWLEIAEKSYMRRRGSWCLKSFVGARSFSPKSCLPRGRSSSKYDTT